MLVPAGLITICIYYFIRKITRLFPFLRKQYQENIINYIGRLLLCIPSINSMYKSKMNKIYTASQKKIQANMSEYPAPLTTIPINGWTDEQIINLIDQYKYVTLSKVMHKHISGTIYSNSLIKPDTAGCLNIGSDLTQRQQKLFSYAFEASYLWNGLHQDEFGIGILIDYQVVHMVGKMFGADSDISGLVTSGGTESLMVAMRSYRNYGLREKGHRIGESVIIAPDTVHAAVIKAADAYNIQIILIETDESGNINMHELEKIAHIYRYQLVAIVASSPCYTTGKIDPIQKLAKIAGLYNAGLHVDCCLGGFIVNYLDFDTDFLKIDGVTSLSVDTHKNGYAPKGSSVLITRKMYYSDKYLIEYSIYSVPDWNGGIYGTPKDNGSTTGVPSLTALVSMLIMGQSTYKSIAKQIQSAVITLSESIRLIDDFIVLNMDCINIVAWKMNPIKLYKQGFIYVMADEMSKLGIIVNTMKNEAVHFCITARFVGDSSSVNKFMSALNAALKSTKEIGGSDVEFSGDARMYCSLESALVPSKSSTMTNWIENILFGRMGAHEAIQQHFMGLLKPFD